MTNKPDAGPIDQLTSQLIMLVYPRSDRRLGQLLIRILSVFGSLYNKESHLEQQSSLVLLTGQLEPFFTLFLKQQFPPFPLQPLATYKYLRCKPFQIQPSELNFSSKEFLFDLIWLDFKVGGFKHRLGILSMDLEKLVDLDKPTASFQRHQLSSPVLFRWLHHRQPPPPGLTYVGVISLYQSLISLSRTAQKANLSNNLFAKEN